jgi:hypothetical protein
MKCLQPHKRNKKLVKKPLSGVLNVRYKNFIGIYVSTTCIYSSSGSNLKLDRHSQRFRLHDCILAEPLFTFIGQRLNIIDQNIHLKPMVILWISHK